MSQRIKGLECTLALSTPDGSDEDVFEDVLEAELNLDFEVLARDYLGRSTQSFDDIYKGVSGSVKVHMEGVTIFRLAEKIQDRAERRTPADGVFSLSFTLNFPDGSKARLTAENLFFETIPLKIPKRDEYVESELAFKCERLRRIL